LATGSLDSTWAFHDIHKAACLLKIDAESPIHSIHFHPDGLLLGAGTEGSQIKIWDLKTQKNAAIFEGHTSAVSSIRFSENGYYLASAADNVIKLWDLRKLKNIHTVNITEGNNITAVEWDYSGTYLAVSGDDIRVFMGKSLNHIATYSKHTKAVTGVKWGPKASFLASCSLDRTLKVWGIKNK